MTRVAHRITEAALIIGPVDPGGGRQGPPAVAIGVPLISAAVVARTYLVWRIDPVRQPGNVIADVTPNDPRTREIAELEDGGISRALDRLPGPDFE